MQACANSRNGSEGIMRTVKGTPRKPVCPHCGAKLPSFKLGDDSLQWENVPNSQSKRRLTMRCADCGKESVFRYKLPSGGWGRTAGWAVFIFTLVIVMLIFFRDGVMTAGVAGFLLIIGYACLFQSFTTWDLATVSKSWTPIAATIVRSELIERTEPDSDDRLVTKHTASISYKYNVDGHEFTSRRIDPQDSDRQEGFLTKSAEKLVAEYPVGREVTAYVDPQNPSEAVLARASLSTHATILFYLVFGAGCIVVTALMLLGFNFVHVGK